MKTFIDWLEIQESQLNEMGKLGRILGAGAAALGGMLATPDAAQAQQTPTAQVAPANQPRLTSDEKDSLKRRPNSLAELKSKLKSDGQYNVDAAKLGVRASVHAYALKRIVDDDQQNKINPKVKQFLSETADLLLKLQEDKTGASHQEILQTLINKYELQKNPDLYFNGEEINPYRTIEAVRKLAMQVLGNK